MGMCTNPIGSRSSVSNPTRSSPSAAGTAQSIEMAKPDAKRSKAVCRLTKHGRGKEATRTYRCTMRRSKGKWTITTMVLGKETVTAQPVRAKIMTSEDSALRQDAEYEPRPRRRHQRRGRGSTGQDVGNGFMKKDSIPASEPVRGLPKPTGIVAEGLSV